MHQEMLLGSRRNRLHVLRWIYGGWLVLQVLFYFALFQVEEQSRQFQNQIRQWSGQGDPEPARYVSAPEVVGRWFTETFVTQQMILLLIATPAFVAGAVTDEKRRGTLQYLLTTDLESRHIILGKLLGRIAQVGLLALAGLPLFFFLAGFAGASPLSLAIALLVLVVPLLALGSVTLLASVWCRQTRDAVLGVYAIGGAAALALWLLGGPLENLDPLFVLRPAWGPIGSVDWAELGRRLALSMAGWGTLSGVCLALAIWRLRPAYIRELESAGTRKARWFAPARQPVDDQPVRWRERHVEGLAPVASLRRVPQGLALAGLVGLTSASSALILFLTFAGKSWDDLLKAFQSPVPGAVPNLFPDADMAFLIQGVAAMLLASLVVGIRCSGTVTGERERKTWESLLLTPVTAKELIRGKLWGVMGASYAYLAAYAVPALLLSVPGGPLAFLATLFCLGITVLAMYFIGAAGIWCSVKSKNSWRSLLSTLGLGYVAGFATYVMSSPIIFILGMILMTFLNLMDTAMGTNFGGAVGSNFGLSMQGFFLASCLGLAAIFLMMAGMFLSWSQRWVADRERTRHWRDEPVYRRRKRVATS
jgi:ABC-type Na+ efflux pump permease subunit